MPRRRVAAKRTILPDPKYHSELLAKFINVMMVDGKKSVAEKVIYNALENCIDKMGAKIKILRAYQETDDEGGEGTTSVGARGLSFLEQVLSNIKPSVEVRSRRVGGATYQIPVEVRASRSMALAMRWLVQAARGRSEKGMALRLTGEMIDAYDEKGNAVKKREDSHRMAKANQAFAHFRWN